MNQALLDRVLKSPRLPSLPTIAIEVIDLVQQQDVNIKQIANTISHDPALSSKILKTVNSSFYGQAHSVATISHALVILGLNSVKTLALGFSLVGNLKDGGGDGFDHVSFWKRSLYSAVAARTLAKTLGLVQQEEAFLGGLLQDLGMLAMNQALGNEYHAIALQVGPEHRKLFFLEQEKLGTNHAEIGAALASSWNLPPLLVQPIKFHENPDGCPDELAPLIRCVAVGSRIGDIFVTNNPTAAVDTYFRLAENWLQIPRDKADGLIKGIHSATVEMRRLFDLPTGELENPDQILANANEALMQINLKQQAQTTELQQQNKQLAEQAVTDSLTGVANRRKFNDFLTEQFAASRDTKSPLSVLFLDTDHFKKFNDTYGHQTGDRVLMELASLLKQSAQAEHLVARYGGEEFAVVLPKTDRITAARAAEAIRRTIQSHIVESETGEKLNITASIGVATFDGGFFVRPEQLVKAADQAVYAAKASGRNCVRIFTPKAESPAEKKVA